ncbi:uncharacterized protein LOC116166456 [Photinus pyralis]|uniref:uncharacterized protein LOC116166456 n=1 Tax=Photinus pyralis TaxID=7054 RepID=UPI0012675AD6|nr:uncharacterized protein LOC116166456 [Photinus pyralis]
MGDFNVDGLKPDNHYYTRLVDTLNSFNLLQIITEPTRIAPHSSTLIDFIIAGDAVSVANSGVVPVHDIADHSLDYCHFILDVIVTPTTLIYRNFNKIDLPSFNNDLFAIPWYHMFDISNLDDKIDFFNSNMLSLFDKHAPMCPHKGKFGDPKPWITENVKRMISLRNSAFKRFKRTSNVAHWDYYKQLRNFTTTAIRNEKKCYLTQVVKSCNAKQLWKKLNQLQLLSKKNNYIPTNFADADEINMYFSSTQRSCIPDFELLDYYSSNKFNPNSCFTLSEVLEEDITKILFKVSSNATGVDGISIIMLKHCCPFLTPYITYIINYCIKSYSVPSVWKCSLLKPIAKVASPSGISDLRPISILPALSKLLEKVIVAQLTDYINQLHVLPATQSGFRAGYGCPGALLDIVDDILKAVDQGLYLASEEGKEFPITLVRQVG